MNRSLLGEEEGHWSRRENMQRPEARRACGRTVRALVQAVGSHGGVRGRDRAACRFEQLGPHCGRQDVGLWWVGHGEFGLWALGHRGHLSWEVTLERPYFGLDSPGVESWLHP